MFIFLVYLIPIFLYKLVNVHFDKFTDEINTLKYI